MAAGAIDRNDSPYSMFSFFKRKSKDTPPEAADAAPAQAPLPAEPAIVAAPAAVIEPAQTPTETRASWMKRLKAGLSKTSTGPDHCCSSAPASTRNCTKSWKRRC